MNVVEELTPLGLEEIINTGPFPMRFPSRAGLGQDEEWCEVKVDSAWRRIRFHDYQDVYSVPGLYETIFYRTLRCNSPWQVTELLRSTFLEHNVSAEGLTVLDLGAGNGMMGEALQNLGIRRIFGIDILDEARDAAKRDRPWVYNEYFVKDMTSLSSAEYQKMKANHCNLLTTVAALGFGDIPPSAFAAAYNLISSPGWLAFNIKEDFLQDRDSSGFSGLIQRMVRKGLLQIESYKRYCHRLNVAGEPLYYIAVAAQKLADIPEEMID